LPFRVAGFGLDGLSLTGVPFTKMRAYFRFLYPVILINSSRIADFSFRPAF
jgi:hypothetical protein